MRHDIVFFVVLLCSLFSGIPQVTALRLGQPSPSEHFARKSTPVQSETIGASECEGRKPQWVQADSIKRLKGPVFNIHIPGPYHSAGIFLWGRAVNVGKMTGHPHKKWKDVANNTELFDDMHWTDLEDGFKEGHTLRDLGCGTDKATIFSMITRHPLNMFLHRWFACNDWKNNLNTNPHAAEEADHVCQHHAIPMCEPGDESCPHDNIILQALVGKDSASLTRADLELAKSRLRHFDLIFIVEHLSHTLQLTTTRLGWRPTGLDIHSSLNATGHKAEERENQKRLMRGEITPEHWQQVVKRNGLDIELYDYMRELSFGMLQADGLPVPTEDERTVIPQWNNKVLTTSFSSWREARTA